MNSLLLVSLEACVDLFTAQHYCWNRASSNLLASLFSE